ncbi:EFR1 family ferrodoxin [Haliovirga abyssi]|uniref:(Fe-S)-binding protein n=1 Tax=Haliovirga abyssi TaxID=2996794 RepID=A0AAU9DE28_9FUSO|nr:EFR1 family ferrodoxin [Haliovirga abyssi]BDU51610.1 (Fe-S)-binding protein [Haliovirga abyssi]
MLKKDIDIYWFSGTGNTYLITNELKEELEKFNIKVNLFKIEKSNPKNIDTDKIIGLAFPVAVQATYPLVWNFIDRLPNLESKNTKIFMIDTLAGFSGGVVGPLKNILSKKGYECIGAKEFIMPSNYSKPKEEEVNRKKVEKSLKKAKDFAKDLVEEKSNWGRVPGVSDVVKYINNRQFIWNSIQKTVSINNDKCIKCGLCAKLCPTNSIRFNKGEYPIKVDGCESCMRCIAFCPQNAILLNKKETTQYKAVNLELFLK